MIESIQFLRASLLAPWLLPVCFRAGCLVWLACVLSLALGLYYGLQPAPMASRFDLNAAAIFGALGLTASVPTVLLWWRLAQRVQLLTASGEKTAKVD